MGQGKIIEDFRLLVQLCEEHSIEVKIVDDQIVLYVKGSLKLKSCDTVKEALLFIEGYAREFSNGWAAKETK